MHKEDGRRGGGTLGFLMSDRGQVHRHAEGQKGIPRERFAFPASQKQLHSDLHLQLFQIVP